MSLYHLDGREPQRTTALSFLLLALALLLIALALFVFRYGPALAWLFAAGWIVRSSRSTT